MWLFKNMEMKTQWWFATSDDSDIFSLSPHVGIKNECMFYIVNMDKPRVAVWVKPLVDGKKMSFTSWDLCTVTGLAARILNHQQWSVCQKLRDWCENSGDPITSIVKIQMCSKYVNDVWTQHSYSDTMIALLRKANKTWSFFLWAKTGDD